MMKRITKQGSWSFAQIVGIILILALIVWGIFFQSGLSEKISSLLENILS